MDKPFFLCAGGGFLWGASKFLSGRWQVLVWREQGFAVSMSRRFARAVHWRTAH